eukprot:s1340_g14.t1
MQRSGLPAASLIPDVFRLEPLEALDRHVLDQGEHLLLMLLPGEPLHHEVSRKLGLLQIRPPQRASSRRWIRLTFITFTLGHRSGSVANGHNEHDENIA